MHYTTSCYWNKPKSNLFPLSGFEVALLVKNKVSVLDHMHGSITPNDTNHSIPTYTICSNQLIVLLQLNSP